MSQNGEWWRMYLSTSITQNSEGIFCAKGKGDVQYSFQCVSFNLLTSSTIFYCILSWQVFNNHGYSSPSCTCSVSSCCILQRALINRTPVYQHDAGAICSSYQEHQASWDAGAGSRHVSAKPRVLPACGTCAEQLKLSPFALKKANSSACVLILFFSAGICTYTLVHKTPADLSNLLSRKYICILSRDIKTRTTLVLSK